MQAYLYNDALLSSLNVGSGKLKNTLEAMILFIFIFYQGKSWRNCKDTKWIEGKRFVDFYDFTYCPCWSVVHRYAHLLLAQSLTLFLAHLTPCSIICLVTHPLTHSTNHTRLSLTCLIISLLTYWFSLLCVLSSPRNTSHYIVFSCLSLHLHECLLGDSPLVWNVSNLEAY